MPPINLNGSTYNKTSGPASYESMQPNGTPWPSVAAAHSGAIYKGISHVRLITVGGIMKEYWYVGGTALENLVLKAGGEPVAFILDNGGEATVSTLGGCIAVGMKSFAVGTNNIASADNSVALGSENVANGAGSFVVGNENAALGQNSFAIGFQTTANAVNSLAGGIASQNEIGANNSIAFGDTCSTQGINCLALGKDTIAAGAQGACFGLGTRDNVDNSLHCGFYNSPGDALFTVGNGVDYTTRSNSFAVTDIGEIVTGNGPTINFNAISATPSGTTATHKLTIRVLGVLYYINLIPA